jgi:ABC-2 type transport system permease protein
VTAAAVSAPVTPSRLDEARRFGALVFTLAVTEWKLRFFGSVLGYLWTLVRPLMFFGVLYVVFTEVAKVGDKIPHFPALLLSGIVLYTFFSEATSGAVTSLVDRESLLRKVRFPRMVVPLAVCLTSFFNLTTNLLAVLAFLLLNGITPTWGWLEVPFLVGLLLVLSVGVGLLLSVAFVRARDVQPIWEVVVQMLFYGSPIFYTIDLYGDFAKYMVLTPFAAILTQLRHALIDPSAPTAAEVAGGTVYMLIPIGITFGLLALGIAVFRRESPRLAERL